MYNSLWETILSRARVCISFYRSISSMIIAFIRKKIYTNEMKWNIDIIKTTIKLISRLLTFKNDYNIRINYIRYILYYMNCIKFRHNKENYLQYHILNQPNVLGRFRKWSNFYFLTFKKYDIVKPVINVLNY